MVAMNFSSCCLKQYLNIKALKIDTHNALFQELIGVHNQHPLRMVMLLNNDISCSIEQDSESIE
jgi:hypothetical protein